MCTAYIFPLKGGITGDFYFLFCAYLDFPKLVTLTFFFLSLQLEREKKKMLKNTKHIQILQWNRKNKWLNLTYRLLVLEGVLELSPDTRQDSLQERESGYCRKRRKHTLKTEASENTALFWGNAHGPVWLEAGRWSVWWPIGASGWESPFTKGLFIMLRTSTFRWWEVTLMGKLFTRKSRHFCGCLFVCDIHSVLWKQSNSYSSLIFYTTIPSHFMDFASFHLKHPRTR